MILCDILYQVISVLRVIVDTTVQRSWIWSLKIWTSCRGVVILLFGSRLKSSTLAVVRISPKDSEMSPIEKPSNLSDGSAGMNHSDGLCAFCNAHHCHILCFLEKTIHEEYISIEFDKFHVMHVEPKHKSYFRTHHSAWTVLYMSTCFLSVNRYVFTLQIKSKLEIYWWNISHNIICYKVSN